MEIEIKLFLDKDAAPTIEAAGYRFLTTTHQVDRYFMVDKMLEGKRSYLRIREDKTKLSFSLDFHQVISAYATQEQEIQFSSMDQIRTMERILAALGMRQICVVDKVRKTYRKGEFSVVLDEVKELGFFVEIEMSGEDCSATRSRIETEVQLLGLATAKRVSQQGYPDLLLRSQSAPL